MVSLAQRSGDNPTSPDGCPTVHLSGDSPADVRALLGVLYNGKRSFESVKIDFTVVAGIVRLSHKYQIQDLLEAALARIDDVFKSKLTCRAEIERGSSLIPIRTGSKLACCAIQAVNLARLTRTDDILLTALYICSLLDPPFITDGVCLPDGRQERLIPKDVRLCINGRVRLASIDAIKHHRISHLTNSACKTSPKCTPTGLLRSFMGVDDDLHAFGDPFCVGSSFKQWEADSSCKQCKTFYRTKEKDLRMEAWDTLPQIFDNVEVGPEQFIDDSE